MASNDHRLRMALMWAVAVAAAAGLLALSRPDHYLLFHSLVEFLSIVVAFGVFTLAWNTRQFTQGGYLLFLGIAHLAVGALDLFHMLAYKGMGVLPDAGANEATQLWIAARALQAVSFAVAPFFVGRRLHAGVALAAYAAVTALLLGAILRWRVFPVCFIEGRGLAGFKVASEYVICAILLLSIPLLQRQRAQLDPLVRRLVVASVLTTVVSEMAFTLYTDVYGLANAIGHLLKIVASVLIYRAIVQTGLRQPYALIFKDLKEKEAALEATARELARSNADLEQFAYAAAHDLQAPLSVAAGYLDLLKAADGQRSRDEKEFIDGAVEGLARMRRLVTDLLTYARVGRGGRDALCRVSSQEAYDQACWDLQKAVAETGAQVSRSALPEVLADPTELRQLFQNLIGNALKFRGDEPPRVLVSAQRQDALWAFSVSDSGIGIEPARVADVFKPFTRLHGRQYEGSGIGLATCKKIVERCGGRIWCESVAGQGATFHFTLPPAPE